VVIRNSSIQINVTRSGNPLSHTAEQTVTGLIPGSYEVLIFDWESDGSFSSTPSFVGHAAIGEFADSFTAGTKPANNYVALIPASCSPIQLAKYV